MFARLILSVALCAAVVLRAQEPLPASLRVTCEPAATLWVNHKPNKTGENFNLTLPPNTPTVLRVSAPGCVTQWRTVTLRPGERRHEPFRLEHEPIPVLFRSERPATVLCDGAELGETPFHSFFDEPRAYRVVIRAEGYQDQAIRLDLSNGKPRVVDANLVADSLDGYRPVSHDVELRAGETIPVTLELQRLPAGLTVTTIPEGARVYVDGAFRGNSDLTLADLPEGPHTLRVEAPGYAQAAREITLAAGATHVEEFRLEIIRGQLALQTQPGVVELWEGKRRLLTTAPMAKNGFTSSIATLTLVPGEHTFTLKARGYADATRTVTIAANKTTDLKVRLDFKPNFEVRTPNGVYRGVIVRTDLDGTLSLELKPGTYRTFLPAEILSRRFLDGGDPTE